MSGHLLKELTIPIFSGFIGYATNWTGVWMLFNPLEFKGRLAGDHPVARGQDGLDRRRQGHRQGRLAV
jgi:hypothetical protein